MPDYTVETTYHLPVSTGIVLIRPTRRMRHAAPPSRMTTGTAPSTMTKGPAKPTSRDSGRVRTPPIAIPQSPSHHISKEWCSVRPATSRPLAY